MAKRLKDKRIVLIAGLALFSTVWFFISLSVDCPELIWMALGQWALEVLLFAGFVLKIMVDTIKPPRNE